MASPGIVRIRRKEAAFSLAAVLLLAGLLALLLITGSIPTAHADGPVLTVSSGTTNPGGSIDITGTGWSPATHYNLYVYGQSHCKPDPICAPPSGTKSINSKPQPIDKAGSFGPFTFTFIKTASITTYVFTVVADYPADTPYTESVLVQVVSSDTPPSGVPVSSNPTVTPTTPPTEAPVTPTTANQTTSHSNGQSTNTGGGNTAAIIIVTILLVIAIAVLVGLLIVLPPKRRAIRAAWYGAGNVGSSGGYRYGASGPAGPSARRTSGAYPPVGGQEPPAWMGGVAQWDDQPRGPRSSRPRPRRPTR
jgi:hypothetical protein